MISKIPFYSVEGVFILIFHVVLNERAKQEIFKSGWKNVARVRAFVQGQPYHSSSPGGSKEETPCHKISANCSIFSG